MRVFLSSTYIDLRDHRAAAAEVLDRLGQGVTRMEVFGARPEEPTVACLREVEASDLFVGIYAHRYGHLVENTQESITEAEFRLALTKRKPVFCFVVSENHPWLPSFVEGEPGLGRLADFKKRLAGAVITETFTTPEDLAVKVATAVGRYLASAPQPHLVDTTILEFGMIRISPRKQSPEGESWSEIGAGEFRRNHELGADPVFDIQVKNVSGNTLVAYRVGIRILQRKPEIASTMGLSRIMKVQAKFVVHFPQEWKRIEGSIDKSASNEIDPVVMKNEDDPFRFTLKLENFCDPENASSCELRFYLVTDKGTAESGSIWLSQ